MPKGAKRLVVRVSGQVQGVFFRHTARLHAEKLGLTGWARNEDDGALCVVAEGEASALEKFLEWCRTGPPLARVDHVQITWERATGEFRRFEIL